MTPRQTAIKEGRQTYLGTVCKRGHDGIRYTVNSDCVGCVILRQSTKERRQYEAKYRLTGRYQEYQKAYQTEYSKTSVYKEQKQNYARNNKPKLAAKSRKYELSKVRRTPSWLTVDDLWMLEQAYELAELRSKALGIRWHVDHVIPLHGRLVSGLHVPQNVQVIPAALNQSKSNRYDVA